MNKFIWQLIIPLLIIWQGCHDHTTQKYIQLIKQWENKEIIFPEKLETKIYGKNISFVSTSHKYKILNYVDTNSCTNCRLKLHAWELLYKEINTLQLDVEIIFMVFAKEYKTLKNIQKNNHYNYPIVYDRDGNMEKLNHFPTLPNCQTFLLDSQNRVILIGNPIGNPSIWELYKEKIKT